ncbi:riboflavin biosynthesis protein RibD C-terminal domain protein [Leptospira inadai serovar Lyme str. 10]|uniref:Riboflavin biosynthesis protein RibD C-terminal domain protein n=2 Tax=Leptospira inadai serovar Lyme TaxID=293084 RepID=V6HAA1_9LEPT|nr:RibD family protein [Leptospira inadai]EQA35268.1 riboflavin biosynthesis protein RibD C-terminal domain protein [Leptospira inadai serovar Lyme str. 10]PNV76127.1 pyrimidine reductase [Leptospira inadai serovar Lyme]
MNLPYLSVNMAMTLDGKVSRPDGKWYGLSSRNDKKRMDEIRAISDGLILGKNSLVNDDPVTRLRYVDQEGEPRPILLVRNGTLPEDRNVFQNSRKKPLLFCTKRNESLIRSNLSELAEIMVLGDDDIDAKSVMQTLYDLEFKNILLEGGPRLNDSFFRKNLIRRIYLTIVPFLIGQSNLPSLADGKLAYPSFDNDQWKLVSCEQQEDEVFLVYDKRI